MSEHIVFILRGQVYFDRKMNSKKRDPFGVIVTDKPYSSDFMNQAWDYAVKETSEKMQPMYEKAVNWLREQHPEWQVIPCNSYRDIEFTTGKDWGVKLYPPNLS